jgi:hypothetical protein
MMEKTPIQKQRMYLRAETIYQFLTDENDELDTLVMCQNKVNLVTTDQSLYEALGSIDDKGKINFNKLVKLLEVTEVASFKQVMHKERKILKDERVNEVRDKARTISDEEDKIGGKENGR